MITHIKRRCVNRQWFYHYNYKPNDNFNIYTSAVKEKYENNVEYIPRRRTCIDNVSYILPLHGLYNIHDIMNSIVPEITRWKLCYNIIMHICYSFQIQITNKEDQCGPI